MIRYGKNITFSFDFLLLLRLVKIVTFLIPIRGTLQAKIKFVGLPRAGAEMIIFYRVTLSV